MNKPKRYSRCLIWAGTFLLSALIAGCGGGQRDPVLGSNGGAVLAPFVATVTPPVAATNVATTTTVISATFNEPIAPLSGATGFTVTCAAPCVNPVGTISLDGTGTVASFTLTAGSALAPLTLYTITVTGARSVATGLVLAAPKVWQFTTGPAPDTTRPAVTFTAPATTNPGPTTGVPTNRAVVAAFTEDMAPATIVAANVTLTCTAPCVSPAGVVSYVASSRSAVFTLAAGTALSAATTYTATIPGSRARLPSARAARSAPPCRAPVAATALRPAR